MPKRIQRQRTKGWRMPEGAVYVGRPTVFGNPCDWRSLSQPGPERRGAAVDYFRRLIATLGLRDDLIARLRGHDLACWCPIDQPCHADVLLELANR
jgi:hypothetical protein